MWTPSRMHFFSNRQLAYSFPSGSTSSHIDAMLAGHEDIKSSAGSVLAIPATRTRYGRDLVASARKNVLSSFAIFAESGIAPGGVQEPAKAIVAACSMRLRNSLAVLTADLGDIADKLDAIGNPSCALVDEVIDLTNRIESVWSICEIFFFEGPSVRCFNLIQWLQVGYVARLLLTSL